MTQIVRSGACSTARLAERRAAQEWWDGLTPKQQAWYLAHPFSQEYRLGLLVDEEPDEVDEMKHYWDEFRPGVPHA